MMRRNIEYFFKKTSTKINFHKYHMLSYIKREETERNFYLLLIRLLLFLIIIRIISFLLFVIGWCYRSANRWSKSKTFKTLKKKCIFNLNWYPSNYEVFSSIYEVNFIPPTCRYDSLFIVWLMFISFVLFM